MAKQIPCAGKMTAVFTPITSPALFNRRAARISRIKRRVRLDDVIHQTAGLRAHRSTKRANDPGRYRLLKTVRRSDGDRDLPDANASGIRQAHMMKVRGVDSNNGKIRFRIGSDGLRPVKAAVAQSHLQIAGVANDMAVRKNESVLRNDESGAATGSSFLARHPNVDHAWGNSIRHRADGFRIRIE